MIVVEYRIEDDRLVDASKTSPLNCIHGRRLVVDSRAAAKMLCHTCAWEVARLAKGENGAPLTPIEVEDVDWELP